MHRYFAVLLAFCASPALAETYFHEQTEHWHIFGSFKKCTALNRPPLENNAAPYNSLEIRLTASRQYELSVTFWPDVVPQSFSNIVLTITPESALQLQANIARKGVGMVTVTEPLPRALARLLESGTGKAYMWLRAEVPDSKAKTKFDISAMPKVMVQLQRCMNALEAAQ